MPDRIQPLLLDPSPLATEAIVRAKTELRDELKELIDAKADLLVAGGVGRHEKALLRIDANEESLRTFKEDLLRVPTRLDERANALSDLFNEKLRTFHERLQTTNTRIDTFHDLAQALREASKEQAESHRQNAKEAVAAAFTSAKELTTAYTTANNAAIAKSETAITKEIDSIKGLIDTTKHGFDQQIANLTGRMDRGEGGASGTKQVVETNRANIAIVIALATMVVLAFASFHPMAPANPTVGADTQRVTDLIAQNNEQNRQIGQRLDALSARITALTPPQK